MSAGETNGASPNTGVHDPAAVVARHREEILRRPALRCLYAHWGARIRARLSSVPGQRIELGCGSGALSCHLPGFVATDCQSHPWSNVVVDACAMPYSAGSVSNLVAIDMLHHLPEPARFFDECRRVLARGGRCILLEPHVSALSYLFYRFLHHEPLDLGADPFGPTRLCDAKFGGPCNEAIPTLCFGRKRSEFERRWPELAIREIESSDLVIYPLTGGYSRPSLIPAAWVERLVPWETAILRRFGWNIAMRLLIVLERDAPASERPSSK